MNTIRIEIKGQKPIVSLIPERLADLSPAQFIYLASFTGADMTEENMMLITNYFLGTMADPLYDFPAEIVDLVVRLLAQKTCSKVFIHEYKDYHSPADHFRNVRIGEFAFADTYYIKSFTDQAYMDKFIATIYREKDSNKDKMVGDIRQDFNEKLIDTNAEKVAAWNMKVKKAIILNYRYIRAWLEELYPYLFMPEDNTSNGIQLGWDHFIRSLCMGDLTKLDQVKDLLIHNVFAEINERKFFEIKEATK